MGPSQLYLGYMMSPIMRFFLAIMYPFAKPFAMLLDHLAHDENDDDFYSRGELAALIQIQHEGDLANKGTKALALRKALNKSRIQPLHSPYWTDMKAELMEKIREREQRQQQRSRGGDSVSEDDDSTTVENQMNPPLHAREIDVIEGALQMKTRLAMDVYTPIRHVYAIPEDMILDKKAVTEVYAQGFSRVPVYEPNPDDESDISRVLGFLVTRQLMMVDWDHCREVSTLSLQRPFCVSPRLNLVDLLHIVQNGSIMTFVCARPDLANKALKAQVPMPAEAGFIGIVTLEDIMESILQDRIYDERDARDRDRAVQTLTRWAATKLQEFYRKKAAQRASMTRQTLIPTIPENDHDADEFSPLLANGKHYGSSDSVV
jgi:metal transporter CNNM